MSDPTSPFCGDGMPAMHEVTAKHVLDVQGETPGCIGRAGGESHDVKRQVRRAYVGDEGSTYDTLYGTATEKLK